MLTFAYQARDSNGSSVSGVQEALNEENAINTLMTRGLMVLSIQQKSVTKSASQASGNVTETDMVLFTRQLATMIDAGLPLVSGLTALYEQCDPRRQIGLKRIIGDLSARVQRGDSFYEAIQKHPKVFNRLYVSMVKAGESGGLLAEILDRLAGFLEASRPAAQEDQIRDDLSRHRRLHRLRHHHLPHRPRRAGLRRDFQRFRREAPRPDPIPARSQRISSAATGITSSAAAAGIFFGIRYLLQHETGPRSVGPLEAEAADLRPADP